MSYRTIFCVHRCHGKIKHITSSLSNLNKFLRHWRLRLNGFWWAWLHIRLIDFLKDLLSKIKRIACYDPKTTKHSLPTLYCKHQYHWILLFMGRNTVPTATNHRNLSNYTDFIRIRLCLFHFVIELRGTCNIIYLLWLSLNEKTLTANCY